MNTTATTQPIVDTTPASFGAQQKGVLRKQTWVVYLSPDSVSFTNPNGQEPIRVARDQGRNYLQFASAFVSGHNLAVKQGKKTYKFKLAGNDLARLRAWLPAKTAADMKQELRNWGIGLVLLGVAHFVLAGFLDPVWGGVIAVVGGLNLLIPHRGMFIVNGLTLLLVGFLNISSGAADGLGWAGFGVLQLIWGIQEMKKFKDYASVQ